MVAVDAQSLEASSFAELSDRQIAQSGTDISNTSTNVFHAKVHTYAIKVFKPDADTEYINSFIEWMNVYFGKESCTADCDIIISEKLAEELRQEYQADKGVIVSLTHFLEV